MTFEPPNMAHVPLPMVAEDDDWLVVNKPSGLLAQPGRGPQRTDSVLSRLAQVYESALLVHRLDMDTSGLMVVARNPTAQRRLAEAFAEHTVKKLYIAVVGGPVHAEHGRIVLPFRLDPSNRPYQIYDPVHGKWGETCWRRLEVTSGHSRIAFTPRTGRTHQLRLHASHPLGLGHAILGDRLYGEPQSAPRLLLHAQRLELVHPRHGATCVFEVPTPF